MAVFRSSSASRLRIRAAVMGLLAALLGGSLVACSPAQDADGTIHVPAEAATFAEAAELAQPGDLILIAPGVYEEQLLLTTPDVTVRGEDRNGVVIDGGGVRPYGIVAMADGIRVENLTVTGATFYGVLFTGLHDDTGPSAPTASSYEPWDPAAFPPLQRFLIDHVTATNNGLYGIYAFNAQNGIIRDSYASGSADSGFYVGQCVECNILVEGNVAERNAVGFENANASDSVAVVGNRFTDNRVGLTLISTYQEAFSPQARNFISGNVIAHNDAEATPAQATGGYATGIGVSGGVANLIESNLIVGHERAGILLQNAEDLPAIDNIFTNNAFEANRVDLANVSADRAPAQGNCLTDAGTSEPVTEPADLFADLATRCGDSTAQASVVAPGGPEAPAGMSFLQVALPIDQPNLPQATSYDPLPGVINVPMTTTQATLPTLDLLADRSGIR